MQHIKLTIIFSILFLSSCSDGVKNSQNIKQDSLAKHKTDNSNTTKQNDYESHDTIFYNSRFLVFGSKEMNIDYIPATEKSYKITSKGDTLFHDYLTTILGDKKYNTEVYVKYYSKYKFSKFLVDSIYQGKLATPNVSIIKNNKYWESIKKCNYLDINQWKEYLISRCKENGINFAGHYTIVEWGCGCQCQIMAIIDRISGKIYFPDIPDDHIDGYYGAQYHKDSRMIIANSAILEDYKGYYLKYFDCYPKIYEWRDTIAKRLE
jgi:hypothetical protein